MANIILWDYTTNKKGESSLMIRVYKDGKRILVSTKKQVKKTDWDSKKERVKPSHPNSNNHPHPIYN